VRLFLAIHLAEDVRKSAAAMQERLKEAGADVRWVTPENLHLTVTFLGDLPDALLSEIEETCGGIAAGTKAFRFRICGGSYFPRRAPTVKTIWVGLAEGTEQWKALVRRAEGPLTVFGVPREGGLVPHITLGRVKGESGTAALRDALSQEAETDCGVQMADELALVQSLLDPRGAVYRDIRRWKLTNRSD
jgi:2'-5' RNA ligase